MASRTWNAASRTASFRDRFGSGAGELLGDPGAQVGLGHLAGDGAGPGEAVVDPHHMPGDIVGRHALGAPRPELVGGQRRAVGALYVGDDRFPPLLVRRTDYRGLDDLGVTEQLGLDGRRADVLAADLDHVLQ